MLVLLNAAKELFKQQRKQQAQQTPHKWNVLHA